LDTKQFRNVFNINKVMELPAHKQYNEYVEEQTPLMDLVIEGHKRK